MRQSVFVGILLTLLMFLLVAAGAIVFMLQGRQQLLNRVERLEGETAALNNLVLETEAMRVERENELATAVAVQATVEYERDQAAAEADDLQRELNDVISERDRALANLSELEAAQEEVVPLVALLHPEDGASFMVETAVELQTLATDPSGLATVHLTIDDEPFSSYEPEDETLFVATAIWTPVEAGEHVLSARAINSRGQASQPVTITVNIVDSTSALNLAQTDDPNAPVRARIETNVVQLRGLEPLEVITPTLYTTAQLRQALEEEFSDYTPEDAAHDALVLSSFDFFEPDFDLYSFTLDLYSEQVSGYYDPETAEFVVVSDDDVLDPYEQTVHAHEYVHALQDQHYALELLDDESLDSEASAALRALAEGDATLVQYIYIFSGFLTTAEIDELMAQVNSVESDVFDTAPPVLAHNLQFPYTYGLEFARYLFEEGGGFDGIDAAWAKLPQSTEQIIHPERYLEDDLPQIVTMEPLTDTLGVGWQQLDEDIFGEFFLREYLIQQLSEEEVDRAATGWGGDRYTVYWNETTEQRVMLLRLAWDTPEDQAEFASLYPQYAAGLFGSEDEQQPDGSRCWQGNDVICLYESGSQLLIVRAPDEALASLVAAVQID